MCAKMGWKPPCDAFVQCRSPSAATRIAARTRLSAPCRPSYNRALVATDRPSSQRRIHSLHSVSMRRLSVASSLVAWLAVGACSSTEPPAPAGVPAAGGAQPSGTTSEPAVPSAAATFCRPRLRWHQPQHRSRLHRCLRPSHSSKRHRTRCRPSLHPRLHRYGPLKPRSATRSHPGRGRRIARTARHGRASAIRGSCAPC